MHYKEPRTIMKNRFNTCIFFIQETWLAAVQRTAGETADSQQCDIVIKSGVADRNVIRLITEELWSTDGMEFMREFPENREWEVNT